jgi:orotate phosphoribosyltransferase-like protein
MGGQMRDRRSGIDRRDKQIRNKIAQAYLDKSKQGFNKEDISRELNISRDIVDRLEIEVLQNIADSNE